MENHRAGTIPLRLLEIPQPPKKLYVKGKLPLFEMWKVLTVVGSRKHTSYGREACQKLVTSLRGYGVIIVSGLALGIDTIAHESALAAGLTTVAFPGSGLDEDVLYPRANIDLAKKIIQKGGAVVSEFEPNLKAADYTFPQRNRLMAGLADAVLIIEAEEKSGTLITARLALDYNKNVLVVPGPIFSETSVGTNSLIREGATPITCQKDLLIALGLEEKLEASSASLDTLEDLTEEEKEVFKILREPTPRDTLIRTLDRPAHQVNATISLLEIRGLVKEELGEIRRA